MSVARTLLLPPQPVGYPRALRAHDRFHAEQDPAALMGAFLPETPSDLAADLSMVTSLFYGLSLQIMAEQLGPSAVDAASRQLFYRLGRAKSRATVAQPVHAHLFFGDVRDLVTLLVSAIYNASPEYSIQVQRYGSALCSVQLSGVDRYYRAALGLGLVPHLSWPPLHTFFEGIRDELGIACTVESRLLAVEPGARLCARYTFRAA